MRSRDYKNPYDSYGEFSKAEMVRVALVEGMKPKYPFQERLRYKELVKRYSMLLREERIDRLFSLLHVSE